MRGGGPGLRTLRPKFCQGFSPLCDGVQEGYLGALTTYISLSAPPDQQEDTSLDPAGQAEGDATEILLGIIAYFPGCERGTLATSFFLI